MVEFEAQLEGAKSELQDRGKQAMKDASDWAESARASAVARAQELASGRVESARKEAEAEAKRIRKKGETDLEAFEGSLAKYKGKAAELVASLLLGERQ